MAPGLSRGFRRRSATHRHAGFSDRGLRGVFSPLAGLNNKKRVRFTCSTGSGLVNTANTRPRTINSHEAEQSTVIVKHNYSPCNIYVGESFTVRLQQWFKFLSYIQDNQFGGIVQCDFSPNRKLGAMKLSMDAVKIRDVPNAGGSSVVSEVLSFELLQKCFKAKLLKTEMEVSYFPEGGSITDYVCDVFGTKLGVSVTRAMKYWGGAYTQEDAYHLLNKKLKGVIQSSRNTLEKWNKQVLHVWSTSHDVTNTLVQAYATLPSDVTSNTVILVTTTTGTSDFIYKNG